MLQAKKLELDQNKAYLHVLYELRLPQKLEKLKVFWKLDLILQGKSLIQKSNVWNRSKFSKFISNAPSKINEKLIEAQFGVTLDQKVLWSFLFFS